MLMQVNSRAPTSAGVRPCIAASGLVVALALLWAGCGSERTGSTRPVATQPRKGRVMITIVYDNNPGREGLETAWGFACVIEGLEKTILFDTGGDGEILLENMRRLSLDLTRTDLVVLSHIHGDHTGGLEAFLRARGGGPVFVPAGFPGSFKGRIAALGGRTVESEQSQVVCAGARTTGTLGRGAIEEHGLCVKTGKGWVVITGCAHPGVAEIAEQARRITGGPIHLILGGFHMGGHSKRRIKAVIDRLEMMPVERAAPCHCSGDRARVLFKERFGDRCVLVGVGSVLAFPPAE